MPVWLVVLTSLTLLAAAIVGLSAARRLRDRLRERRIYNGLLTPDVSGSIFTPDLLRDLPDAASRYLTHAIAGGAALARTVDLTMRGEVRADGSSDWLAFEARERLCLERGFIWQGRLHALGPLDVRGADWLYEGAGMSRFYLAGLLPVVRERGEQVTLSSVGRLLIESIWLPSALLKADWQAVDGHRAVVHFPAYPDHGAVQLVVDEVGALQEANMMRARGGEGGETGLSPFGARIEAEASFDGFTIPTRLRAGWGYGTDDYEETFRARVEDARFY